VSERLARRTAVVGAMTVVSRVLGLARDVIIARAFGAAAAADAFFVAFRVPNLFRRWFGEGAFSQAFVPVLSEYRERYRRSEVEALVAALGVMISPQVAFWGRQVMLEVPCLAYMVWSMASLALYIKQKQFFYVVLASVLFVAALYTKLNAIFLVPVIILTVLLCDGWSMMRSLRHWRLAGLIFVLILPLVVHQLTLGIHNMSNFSGAPDAELSRLSFENIFWYAKRVPELLGWPLVCLFVVGSTALVVQERTAEDKVALMCFVWIVLGYIFLTITVHKEVRHGIYIAPPLVFLGIYGICSTLRPVLALSLGLVILVAVGTHSLATPVPALNGPRMTAEYVAAVTKPEGRVLFSGHRDADFIYNLHTLGRDDIRVVRLDKLLYEIESRITLIKAQTSYDAHELRKILDNFCLEYVVHDEEFLADTQQMGVFREVLTESTFEMKRIFRQYWGNSPYGTRIDVYQVQQPLPSAPARQCVESMDIKVPLLVIVIHGNL
jgi:hypothetical protein